MKRASVGHQTCLGILVGGEWAELSLGVASLLAVPEVPPRHRCARRCEKGARSGQPAPAASSSLRPSGLQSYPPEHSLKSGLFGQPTKTGAGGNKDQPHVSLFHADFEPAQRFSGVPQAEVHCGDIDCGRIRNRQRALQNLPGIVVSPEIARACPSAANGAPFVRPPS
jgi:hypothetical protein